MPRLYSRGEAISDYVGLSHLPFKFCNQLVVKISVSKTLNVWAGAFSFWVVGLLLGSVFVVVLFPWSGSFGNPGRLKSLCLSPDRCLCVMVWFVLNSHSIIPCCRPCVRCHWWSLMGYKVLSRAEESTVSQVSSAVDLDEVGSSVVTVFYDFSA